MLDVSNGMLKDAANKRSARTFLFRRHKIFATCPASPVISVALAAALAHWWLVDSALRTCSQYLVAHTDHTAMDGAGDAVEHLHVKLPCATLSHNLL